MKKHDIRLLSDHERALLDGVFHPDGTVRRAPTIVATGFFLGSGAIAAQVWGAPPWLLGGVAA